MFLTNLDFNFCFKKFCTWLAQCDGALSCTNVKSLFRYIASTAGMLQIGEMLQVGGSTHFDFIYTNKERLTNTFPGYHSGYHKLFWKFVSFTVQALLQLHIFLGTIEINFTVLAISWYLKGKALLILKHELQ